ncbi:GntR family transcriptional regulator [Schumannella luteola]|uniref:GntR family transcriptional regulator n=1 Tax=Schumannella luteola TaxID=472059 RepID=A0A852Y5H0_9MICO|nr:GntR family transcriptional regulator [Schumannella luteola]
MAQTIERDSPVAYYEQLFVILRDQILSGDIPADERLPSEMELCREYGLSRATVRQTMSKLESEGFARRVARRGVFASSPEQSTGWTVEEGFLESQVRQGQTGVTTQVVDARLAAPAQHVAEALELADDAQVFALQRVRSLDGKVAMFSTNWFPKSVGETVSADTGVMDGTGSLNETLRRAGFVSNGAKRVIRAMRPTEAVAAHLQIDADQPVLRVRSLSWDARGTRFDYYETWVLTDIIPLEVSVSAS